MRKLSINRLDEQRNSHDLSGSKYYIIDTRPFKNTMEYLLQKR